MAVLIGIVIVLGAIFGGYMLEGGFLGPLFQPYELLMIAGGGLGAFIISNDRKSMMARMFSDRNSANCSALKFRGPSLR